MTGSMLTDGSASAREQIVRAAAESLLENGYAGTSVRAIASRAGVAIGNLQYYFPTKSELLVEAWRYLTARSVDELRAACNRLNDPLEALELGVESIWDTLRQLGDMQLAAFDLLVDREVLVPLVLNTVLGFGLYYVVTRDDDSCVRALSAFRQLAASLLEPVWPES